MTTSYRFIICELREIALGCGNTLADTTFACLSPIANSVLAFAFFVELQHGRTRGDFDCAVDDGAPGDGDGARADLAADHGGVADFQFVPDTEASGDLAGDDCLVGLDEAVPASRGGQIEPALQIAVTVHLAQDHEMPGAADIPYEHGVGADKGRRRRMAFEESTFLFVHRGLLTYRRRP